MYTFAIIAFDSPTNTLKWTGTVTDDTCPLFALKELANWEATTPVVGARLSFLNPWYFAEVVEISDAPVAPLSTRDWIDAVEGGSTILGLNEWRAQLG